LAWAQIEIRRYGDALQTLNRAVHEQKIQPERRWYEVANWQAQEHDEAMRDFDIALGGPPEWKVLTRACFATKCASATPVTSRSPQASLFVAYLIA
jgi:hypothetical protein